MADFGEIARRFGGVPSGGAETPTRGGGNSFDDIARQFGGRLTSGKPMPPLPEAQRRAPVEGPPQEPDTDILDRLSAGTKFETPGGAAFRQYSEALQRYNAQQAQIDATKDEGFFDRLGSMFTRADIGMQGAGRDIAAGLEKKYGDEERARQMLAQSEALRKSASGPVAGEISTEDVSKDWLKAPEFLAQQAAGSLPAMILAASGIGAPAAATTLGGQVARSRAEADNRQGFLTGEDMAIGTGVAVASTALDMIGLGGILGGTSKTVLGRVGKAFAAEGVTEALQSGLEYTGGSLGTEQGFDPSELGRQMLVGGLTGAGIGAGIRGVGEVATAPFRASADQKQAEAESKRLELEAALTRAKMSPTEKARAEVVDRFENLYGFSREDAEKYTDATLQMMSNVSEATGTPLEKAPTFTAPVEEVEEEGITVQPEELVETEEEAITLNPEDFGFTAPPVVEEPAPVAEAPAPVAAAPVVEEPAPVAPAPVVEAPAPVATAPVVEEPAPVEAAAPVVEEPAVEEAVAEQPAPVEEPQVTVLEPGVARGAYEEPSAPILSRDAVAPEEAAGDITEEQRRQIDFVNQVDDARKNLLIDNLERNELLSMLVPPPGFAENPAEYPQWREALSAQQQANILRERLEPQIKEAEAQYEAAKEAEKRKYNAKSAKGIPESNDMRLARIKKTGLEAQIAAAQENSLKLYDDILTKARNELKRRVALRKIRTADIERQFKTGKIDARERAIRLRENKVQRLMAEYRISGAQTELAKSQLAIAQRTKSSTAVLKHVAASDSPLAVIAERLLKIAPNVPIRVVSPEVMASMARGMGERLPEAPQGMYVPDRGAIYLSSDMVTDHAVIHEVIHAIMHQHITNKTEFGRRIEDIYKMYNGLASDADKQEYGFKDAQEFVAEVWGNQNFRDVLERIIPPQAKTEEAPKSLFDRIVDAVKKLFSKKEDAPVRNYIEEVMSLTEAAAAQPVTSVPGGEALAAPAAKQPPMTPEEIRKVVEADERVSRGMAKAQVSNNATEFAAGINTVIKGKSKKYYENPIMARWNALTAETRAPILTTLSTDYIIEINKLEAAKEPDIAPLNSILEQIIKTTDNINGMRAKLRDRFDKLSDKFTTYANKNGTSDIGMMLSVARVNGVDPFKFDTMEEALVKDTEVSDLQKIIDDPNATPQDVGRAKSSMTLRRREIRDVYQLKEKVQGTKGGVAVAQQLVQFYSDMFTALRVGLNKDIEGQDIDPEAKQTLINAIEEMRRGAGEGPYNPFMRFGKYWLTVEGSVTGSGRERYHFESALERDQYRLKRAKELGKNPDDGSIFKTANSLEEFVTGLEQDSFLLAQINKTINGLDLKADFDVTGLTPEEATVKRLEATDKVRNELKDQFYQLYLMSLPEQSIKKQMLHAEFVTGQSTDWLRVFNVSALRYANQLPKVKYGAQLRREIESAYDFTDGMAPRMREKQIDILNEITDRANNAASPPDSGKLTSALSNLTFIQLMSSLASAFNQTTAVPMAVMPYLNVEYGYGSSAKMLAQYLNIMNSVGILEQQPNGEYDYSAPSIGTSSRIRNNPTLRKAFDILSDERALFAQTGGTMFLESAPTMGRSKWNYVGKAYDAAMKALAFPVSTLERTTSEMTAMMAFELHYAKTKDFDASIEAAIYTVRNTIGNYSAVNRPTVIDNLVGKDMGRLITQFRMFAVNQYTFIFSNMRKVLTTMPLSVDERLKALHHATGRLLMVAMGAGVVGLPLVSTIAMIGDAIDYLTDDDEERKARYRHDPYTAYDSMANFRKYWIPQHFGDVGFMVGDRQVTMADMLDKGVPTALTGINFQSRLSMDNMWFRDSMSGETWKESAINWLAANLSPTTSVQLDMLDGIDKIISGDFQRGFEKMAPAAVRGALQAERYETEGAKTLSGKTIMSKQEFSEVELAMQRIGFQPAQLAEFQRKRIDFENARAKATKKRVELMQKYNAARLDPNTKPGDLKKLADEIYDFNATHPVPSMLITPERLQNSLNAILRVKGQTVRGLRLTPEEARYFYGPEYQGQFMDEGTEEDDFLFDEE